MNETRKFIYGSNVVEQPIDVPVEDVQSAMSEFFPELVNAVHEEDENGNIIFTIRAASKGSNTRVYVYGNSQVEQPADIPIEDVQSAMAEFFPELVNATYTEDEDGVVTFQIRAASKGN